MTHSSNSQNSSQTSNQWNLGRFVKTLSYFGAVPVLSNLDWFQRWFGSRPDPRVDSRMLVSASSASHSIHDAANGVTQVQTGELLVIGSANAVGRQVVQQLTAQGRQFKQVDALSALSNQQSEALDPETAIICCTEGSDTGQTVAALLSKANEFGFERRMIFDFAHPSADMQEVWGALDDVVMGGVSQSGIRLGNGVAYFSGVVSTANSGGFASVRTRNLEPPLDLSNYEGVELRVKGDGKRYKFMVRTETRWDGVAHCYSFDTVADEWITVRIPFADLIPVFRARTIANSPVDPSRVYAWQLMLSKFEYDGALNPHFEPGFFQIQVKSISVYRQSQTPKVVLVGAAEGAQVLKTSGIPYTIIQPSEVVETAATQTLQVARQTLEGEVSAEDVAALCLAALEHPMARNLTLFVTAGESSCAAGDWPCLFKLAAD
jgi:hypothetical protein